MEQKEKDRNCEQVVSMDSKRGLVAIKNPKGNDEKKEFTFDSVYDWKWVILNWSNLNNTVK